MPSEPVYVDMHAEDATQSSKPSFDPHAPPVTSSEDIQRNERVRKENLARSLANCYINKSATSLNLTRLNGLRVRDLFASHTRRQQQQQQERKLKQKQEEQGHYQQQDPRRQQKSLYSPRASDLLSHNDFEETVLHAPSVEYFNRLTQYIDSNDSTLGSGVSRDEQRRRNQYILEIRETPEEREMKRMVQFEKNTVIQDQHRRLEQDRSTEDYLREIWFHNRAQQSAKQRLKSHTGRLVGQWNRQLSRFDEETNRRCEVELLSKRQVNLETLMKQTKEQQQNASLHRLRASVSPAEALQHYKQRAWSRNSAELMKTYQQPPTTTATIEESEDQGSLEDRYFSFEKEVRADAAENKAVPEVDLSTVEWAAADLSATARAKLKQATTTGLRKKKQGNRQKATSARSAKASPAASRPRTVPPSGRAGKRVRGSNNKTKEQPAPTTSQPRNLFLSPHSSRTFRSTMKSVQATNVFQPYSLELSYTHKGGYHTPRPSSSLSAASSASSSMRPHTPSQASHIAKQAEMDLVDAIKTKLEHNRVSIPRGRLERALISPRQSEQDQLESKTMAPPTFNLLAYPFAIKKKKKKTKKKKKRPATSNKTKNFSSKPPANKEGSIATVTVSNFAFDQVEQTTASSSSAASAVAAPVVKTKESPVTTFANITANAVPSVASSSSSTAAAVTTVEAVETEEETTTTATSEKTEADVQAVVDAELKKDKELEKLQ